MSTYNMRYRTFDQLLEDVNGDFKNFALEGLIEPETLIKVARRVNYDLGLRLNKDIEVVLEVEKGRVKLPDNFYILNFALLCGEYTVTETVPQGTQIEELDGTTPLYQVSPPALVLPCGEEAPECSPIPVVSGSSCCLDKCGNNYRLVQVIKTQTRTYSYMLPLKIRKSNFVDCKCPNINMVSIDEAWIKDGYLYTSFDSGNIYLNYTSLMEDEEGNLLVADHEMYNEYYEYALKERILEALYFNGEDVERKLQYAQGKLKKARLEARRIVDTPDFAEMRKLWEKNRKAMYAKYYYMFAS